MVQKGAIKLQYVSIDEQVADVLTKPLSQVKFEYFRDKLGVVRKDFPCKEEQWWYYKLSLQEGMLKIRTLFGKEEQVKDMVSLGKEEQVEVMNPLHKKGEHVDDIDPV